MNLASSKHTLVVGIGNRWRSDDGVGPAVAGRLLHQGPPGVAVTIADGGAAELVEVLSEADHAVLIDAARSGASPGTIHRFDGTAAKLPVGFERPSTHGLGVAEALELARALDRLPARVTVYGIEGANFEHGEALSPEVEEAAEKLAEELTWELGAEAAD